MERLDLSRRADSCPTAPAASSWNASRLDVFVEGTNGALYQKIDWLVGLASLGGSLTSKMTEMLLLIASIDTGRKDDSERTGLDKQRRGVIESCACRSQNNSL
jgi:hypothetical protein